jgi:predicted ATPase
VEIKHIHIQSYRSLWDVTFRPEHFTAIVGANNAGKSNFLDALHFLGEVHRHGVELAVSRKGGYENIAFRRKRRSKRPIAFHIVTTFSGRELRAGQLVSRPTNKRGDKLGVEEVTVVHSFVLSAASQKIDADFSIRSERILLFASMKDEKHQREVVSINRDHDHVTFASGPDIDPDGDVAQLFYPLLDSSFHDYATTTELSPTELAINSLRYSQLLKDYQANLAATRLHQLAPIECRRSGVPTPSPEFDLHGGNLPAMVDYLQKNHKKAWNEVLASMQRIIPDLHDVRLDYTTDRRLSLSFLETGYGRPWTSEDVSDGTIQSLALFCALFDPRSHLTLIEEPENSVHPWIVRIFAEACRRARNKQIVVSTHSPVFLDHLRPDEIAIVSRQEGRTSVVPMVQVDQESMRLWSEGSNTVFELLDAGGIEEAIPPLARIADDYA